jgi:16S rRNA (adenine1518-N6/adenine1519-N6)-dimethyltransferase
VNETPSLRESLAAAGLTAKKSLGQHFLLDLNLTRKIVRLAGVTSDDHVLEVGPGPGGLTRALMEAGAQIVAVEKDPRFLPLLQDLALGAAGRLTVIEADALTFDEEALGPGALIVANLPYNVATPLLVKWLTGPLRPRSMVLMFQKEVAQRIVAQPGSKAYGRLSIIAQALCEASIVLDLPARAFNPPPKVASAVVRLVPRPERPSDALIGALQQVTACAFGQRRKMLRSSLAALGGEAFLEKAGVDPSVRAETLRVGQYLELAAALLAKPLEAR